MLEETQKLRKGAIVGGSYASSVNILAPACYFDYKEQRIPNEVTYTMFVSGLIMQAIFGSLKEAFMGILILVVLLSFLSKVFQLGGGDIKLIIGCGAWLGKTSPYFLFFTLLFLLIYNCIALLRKLDIGQYCPK